MLCCGLGMGEKCASMESSKHLKELPHSSPPPSPPLSLPHPLLPTPPPPSPPPLPPPPPLLVEPRSPTQVTTSGTGQATNPGILVTLSSL